MNKHITCLTNLASRIRLQLLHPNSIARKGQFTLCRRTPTTPFGGTESYNIIIRCTVYQWWRCIKGVTIIRRTSLLKNPGILAWFTLVRAPILISATELVKIKRQTSTFARHYFPFIIQHLKLLWTNIVQIFSAPSNVTFRRNGLCHNRNRNIVAIN